MLKVGMWPLKGGRVGNNKGNKHFIVVVAKKLSSQEPKSRLIVTKLA